jgi:hypothetical protein
MDRLPSVGNGYVAPREAGPGRRSHAQSGADRTAWTRLSTVLLSDADVTSPRSRHATSLKQRNQPRSIPTGNQFARRSPIPLLPSPSRARIGAGYP